MADKRLFFGLKRSKEDPNERKLSLQPCEKLDLPSQYSLKDKVKQVYDQLSMNSCSANATANFLQVSGNVECAISRLYLYFCTRYIDNNYMMPVEDHGATLRSVFTALANYHFIEEVEYPYLLEKVDSVPPSNVFKEAVTVKKSPITSYRQIIPTTYSIKYAIAHLNKPVLFGMMVYSNFFHLTKDNDILNSPSPQDELLGGHAVVIVGYDDATQTFEILNSHGSSFANEGYFRMPYSYALNKDLAFEFYIVN